MLLTQRNIVYNRVLMCFANLAYNSQKKLILFPLISSLFENSALSHAETFYQVYSPSAFDKLLLMNLRMLDLIYE